MGFNGTQHESELTSDWSLIAREQGESTHGETQMMAAQAASASSNVTWNDLSWQIIKVHVHRLQVRIAKVQ